MRFRLTRLSTLFIAGVFLASIAGSAGYLSADPEALPTPDPTGRPAKRIAFEVKTDFSTDIFVIDIDGSKSV